MRAEGGVPKKERTLGGESISSSRGVLLSRRKEPLILMQKGRVEKVSSRATRGGSQGEVPSRDLETGEAFREICSRMNQVRREWGWVWGRGISAAVRRKKEKEDELTDLSPRRERWAYLC